MKIFQSYSSETAKILKNGGVGIIPTDTIYGLAAALSSQQAVERIFSLKNRPSNKRVGTVLISDPKQIAHFVDTKILAHAISYWPGPVSVELPIKEGLDYAHRGNGTLAFRMPKNQELLEYIAETGPLATSSANRADSDPATNIPQAIHVFNSRVDFYIDHGDLSKNNPSKIIKIKDGGEVEVIREG